MKMVVIDYDAGNTANVLRALAKLGIQAQLSADPQVLAEADGLILPGVGAFASAMAELQKRGLVQVIQTAVGSRQTSAGDLSGHANSSGARSGTWSDSRSGSNSRHLSAHSQPALFSCSSYGLE